MMNDPEIAVYPAPILTTRALPLRQFSEHLDALAAIMRRGRRANRGLGIAAPQLGIPTRIFLVGSGLEESVVVNPEIDELAGEQWEDEGCLSLPRVRLQVRRATSLRLRGRTIRDEPFDERIDEPLLARVVQHEMDHLDGVLTIDRVGRQERRRALRELGIVERVRPEQRRPRPRRNASRGRPGPLPRPGNAGGAWRSA